MSMSNQDLEGFAWNTGRWYSAHGQRIAAVVLESGRVAFMDIDRNISGATRHAFMVRSENPLNHRRLQAFVMREYDNCAYDDLASTFWMMSRGAEWPALRVRLTAMAWSAASAELDPSAAAKLRRAAVVAALAVLEDFNDLEQIDELYDEHPALASALATLIPGFKYPDWSHRTIADVRRAAEVANRP